MNARIIFTLLFLSTAWVAGAQNEPVLVTSRGVNSSYTSEINGVETTIPDNAVRPLADQVADTKQWMNTHFPGRPVYVVGHSMGGLRALGYTSVDPNVKGVVTIGSPVKGFSPLMTRGTAGMTQTLFNIGSTILTASTASWEWKNGVALSPFNLSTLQTLAIAGVRYALGDSRLLATGLFLSPVKSELLQSVADGTPAPVLTDMTPGSTFLNGYVAPEFITLGYWARVELPPVTVTLPFGGTYQVLGGYQNVWVVTNPSFEVKHIPANVKVLNIVGTENDITTVLTEDQKSHLHGMSSDFLEARDGFYSIASGEAVIAAGLYAMVFPSFGATLGPAIAMTAVSANDYYTGNQADEGYRYASDPNRVVNEVLGVSAHDTAIPQADQWRLDMGGTPAYPIRAGGLKEAQVIEYRVNHVAEGAEPGLWGPGGGVGAVEVKNGVWVRENGGIAKGGKVEDFLFNADPNDWRAMFGTGNSISSQRTF